MKSQDLVAAGVGVLVTVLTPLLYFAFKKHDKQTETPAAKEKEVSRTAIVKPTAKQIAEAEEEELNTLVDSDLIPEDIALKMVILVRTDLNMSKGKIAAQVGHAVLGAYKLCLKLIPDYVNAWTYRAQAKITLKVKDEAEMDKIVATAREHGLPTCTIEDAGRTEVEPGTRTCAAIGPAPVSEIDKITGRNGIHPLSLLH